MHILITILFIISCLVILVLIIALIMKREHFVRREIIINAPRQKVFAYLKLLKNQDEFNEHAKAGSDRKREFKGTDGTVGYIYIWKGDKNAGEGEKEIISIIEGEKIETEIRFVKPMKIASRVIMETESISEDRTRVYWSNSGSLPYPLNIMVPMLEKSLPKAMDISLANLKNILEKK